MYKSFLLFAGSILSPLIVGAQNYWLEAGASYTQDVYKIEDRNGLLQTVPLPSIECFLRVRKKLNNNLFADAAISTKPYWEGFTISGARLYGIVEAFRAVSLNAGIGYRIKLTEKMAFVPKVGVGLSANTSTYIGTVRARDRVYVDPLTTYTVVYAESEDVHRFFGLMNVSIGLERDLFKSFLVRLHAGYYQGFMKANQLDVQYSRDPSEVFSAVVTSTGSYWDVGIALLYNLHQL